MSQDIYLQPVGFLYGETAKVACAEGAAGFIGAGDIGFHAVKLYRRGAKNGQIISYCDVSDSSETAITERLQLIENPRPVVCGLDLKESVVMGIVNTTPDSFSDGGHFLSSDAAISHGRLLAEQGAHILDIGGESTRPGATEVRVDEELKRTLPVVEALSSEGYCVSIDTRKSEVMRSAYKKGAAIINDVSALQFDEESVKVAAESDCPVILMHAQGRPETMQKNPEYEHVVLDVFDELSGLIQKAEKFGVKRENIIADPGIGFGKTTEHNVQIMGALSLYHGLGVPLLLGASRKRFLGEITGEKDPRNRVAASLAAVLSGVLQGVQIFRVHDVLETARAIKTIKNMQN